MQCSGWFVASSQGSKDFLARDDRFKQNALWIWLTIIWIFSEIFILRINICFLYFKRKVQHCANVLHLYKCLHTLFPKSLTFFESGLDHYDSILQRFYVYIGICKPKTITLQIINIIKKWVDNGQSPDFFMLYCSRSLKHLKKTWLLRMKMQ